MDNINTGFPTVVLSITNPDVKREDAKDKFEPYTFLQFIKTVSEDFVPETLNTFYNNYINEWNVKTGTQASDNKEIIIDRYRDFLKDITLNFSTNAEKKFLTQLNFDDKYDLQTAMSFYSTKIRNIVLYYKKKRGLLHYSVTRAKVKGSNIGAVQAVKDVILDFLENRSTSGIDYDIDVIKDNLSVSITEYFDNYSQYFNRDPDTKDYGANFKEYEPGTIPEDKNLFLTLEQEIVDLVFARVATDIRQLKEASEVFSSKKRQTEKFMGTDFYYLSTDRNGTPDMGILFSADKPYANFLNQKYPSTASVFSNDIISERDLGYFRPTNTAIATIQGKRIDFYQQESYPPGSLYIFPDPNLFTNNDQILTFIVDTSTSINNRSKGIAINQPNLTKESTGVIGYASQISENRNLNTDLSYLYDQGYIDQSKKDVFGNSFGLVKDNNYYRKNLETETEKQIKSLVVNGYQFFDDLYNEGFNFNYDTADSSTFSETIRSGLTAFTNGLTAVGDQTPELPLSTYSIFARYYNPYQELLIPTNFLEVDYGRPETLIFDADVKDGAYFRMSETEALKQPIRTGLSAFTDSSEQFYFSDLVEAGIGYYDGGTTVVRALCDNTGPGTAYTPGYSLYEGFSGNFTFNVRLSGDNNVKNYDGVKFTDNIIFNYTQAEEGFDYRDEVYSTTSFSTVQTASDKFFNKRNHTGKIYVKNVNESPDKPAVKQLTDALDYLSGKYSTAICDELSTKVVDFDILYQTLFIETSSYLVTEKTVYENSTFISPRTFTNSITLNTDFFDKISNRLRVNNDAYFCKMVREQKTFKNILLYPKIYKYTYTEDKTEQIYPTTGNPAVSSTCFFNISSFDVVPIECGKPILTYNSDNEQFNLAVLVKDLNKGPALINYLFEYTDEVKFLDSTAFVSNNSRFTHDFISDGSIDLDSLRFTLSSTVPTLCAESTPISAASLIL